MGLTYIDGTATGPAGEEHVRFLVDSGASYTVLPARVWTAIGLEARRSIVIRLADGTDLRRQIGTCTVRLPQGETPTPVILGAERDLPLLGAVTLEELGLVLDPLSRQLHAMQVLLPLIQVATGQEQGPS